MTLLVGNRRALLRRPLVTPPAGVVRTTRALLMPAAGAGPYTFNDIDIGDADATKVVGVISYTGVNTGTVSATGNGAAMSHPIAAPSGTRLLDYFEILEPDDTLFDLVVTPTGTGARFWAEVFTITGQSVPGYSDISSSAPTASAAAANLPTGAVDVPTGGVVSAGAMYNATAGTMAWSPSGTIELNGQVGSGGPIFSTWHAQIDGSVNPDPSHSQGTPLMRSLAVTHG